MGLRLKYEFPTIGAICTVTRFAMAGLDVDMTRIAAVAISDALRDLLENKHLYQSVSVSRHSLDQYKNERIIEAVKRAETSLALGGMSSSEAMNRTARDCDASIHEILEAEWLPPLQGTFVVSQQVTPLLGVNFTLPTIHTFCPECEERWPFNPNPQLSFSTLFSQSMFFLRDKKCQVFVLTYQCQSCKGEPLVFEVRREQTKLTLCGRSIIESLPVPKSLPKPVAKFYADAHIAHNAGQTLAGLFLLRTFIEQFWRQLAERGAIKVSNKKSQRHADELGTAYSASLPADFKVRFPSLTKIYEQISDCLHSGKADGELFVKSASEIEEHFEARRLYKQDAVDKEREAETKEKQSTTEIGQAKKRNCPP
jgi:hypothetical protein